MGRVSGLVDDDVTLEGGSPNDYGGEGGVQNRPKIDYVICERSLMTTFYNFVLKI